jgi:hypothetical protein
MTTTTGPNIFIIQAVDDKELVETLNDFLQTGLDKRHTTTNFIGYMSEGHDKRAISLAMCVLR